MFTCSTSLTYLPNESVIGNYYFLNDFILCVILLLNFPLYYSAHDAFKYYRENRRCVEVGD